MIKNKFAKEIVLFVFFILRLRCDCGGIWFVLSSELLEISPNVE